MQPMFVSVVGAKYSSPLALPQRHARRQAYTAKPNPKTCWNSPADWLLSGRGSTLLENRKGHKNLPIQELK